ncbi:hypothetical protein [Sorangium cellulosum]|uniref:hypothetical protein n=1 Tax=Sorangium cellulosum TaxID=56 RepID=UPI00101A77E3|nr:hypothetical protein [Sorangium cellulosum]
MSEATDNTATEHAETEHEHAEADRPPNSLIFVIVIATLLSLVVTVLFVNEVFKATMEREISSKVLEPPNSALRAFGPWRRSASATTSGRARKTASSASRSTRPWGSR